MTATLVMELLCGAGLLFMIRFLVALLADGRRNSHSYVVFRPSGLSRSDKRLLYHASDPGAGGNGRQPAGFEVITGGSNRPARKVG